MALAAFVPGALRAEGAPVKKRELKKGYFLNTFPGKYSVLEKFTMLKEAGFDGVEPPCHMDQAEVLKACEATGLKIASVSCGTYTRSLSSANPATRKQGLDGLMQGLRDAKAYGATSVLVVAGNVDEKTSYADAYQRTQEEIRKAIPLAEELGVKMAIENVWNQFLLSPLEAARYVDEFKSLAVGWHFDVGNVITYGWPEQWIRILGKRIQKVHIKEYSRKKRDEGGFRKGFAVEYLEGDDDWPAVMKALDEIGYKGWAIAEPAWKPEGVDIKERLKTIAEKMDKILAL
jgi:L-ribulose-5-phosphate 3-epimerase